MHRRAFMVVLLLAAATLAGGAPAAAAGLSASGGAVRDGGFTILVTGTGLLPGSPILVTATVGGGSSTPFMHGVVGPDGTFAGESLGRCQGGAITAYTFTATAATGSTFSTTIPLPC
jgi:hypothetical protein